jgi:hypothetical protein
MGFRLKMRSIFPALVQVTDPLTLIKSGVAYTFGVDPSKGALGPAGAGYGGTSTTSLAIATGSKSFTTQAGYAYQAGNYIRASSAADGTNYMEGTITSYTGTSLVLNVSKVGGSGTKTDWTFSLSGTPGATGAGTGDMLAANNLSDVSNKKTSLDNLSVHGADIASATTTNLETSTGDLIDVTGTTTITAITLNDGHERTVRFTGILLLTHGASLLLPGAANITTAAGDFAVFRGYAAGVVRCVGYQKAAGINLIASNNLSDVSAKYTAKDNISVHGADVASATTTNLETATGDLIDVTGTTTITAITLSEGHERTVRFTGILTLTNGASLVIPGAVNFITAAGDFVTFRGYAAGVVRVVAIQLANSYEEVSTTVAIATPFVLSTGGSGVVWNTVSIPRAGLWEVGGNSGVSKTGGTTPVWTHMHADHNTSGGTVIQTAPGNGSTVAAHVTSNNENGWLLAHSPIRYRTTGPVTVNFVMTADFTGGTGGAYGRSYAVRVAP